MISICSDILICVTLRPQSSIKLAFAFQLRPCMYCESLTQPQPTRIQLLYLPSIHHSLAFILAFPGFQTQHIIALQIVLFCAPKQNRAPPMNNSQHEGECVCGLGVAGWHECERVRETGIEWVGERERETEMWYCLWR